MHGPKLPRNNDAAWRQEWEGKRLRYQDLIA